MNIKVKTLVSLVVLAMFASSASAADYNNWGVIDPYGLQQQDEWGNIYYTDPYAYDSQVDIYGNVISSDSGMLDPSLDYYDLTPVQPDTYNGYSTGGSSSSTYVPYANPVDSHQSFINSIWE